MFLYNLVRGNLNKGIFGCFFDEVIPDVKLDLQSREFITGLITELRVMKEDLAQTLNKIKKAS